MNDCRIAAVVSVALLVWCCSPQAHVRRSIHDYARRHHHHTGFVLADAASGKILVDINGDRYFTPASNTKVLTLLASVSILGDTIPALQYRVTGDSLIFRGTGDPSFLNPFTWPGTAPLKMLQEFPGKLFLYPDKYNPQHYGPGWSWDDYDTYYQAERGSLPMYGHVIRARRQGDRPVVEPGIFTDSVQIIQNRPDGFRRRRESNRFFLDAGDSMRRIVPFVTSVPLIKTLLEDTLKRPINIYSGSLTGDFRILKGVPADSLYKTMMQDSDNFIADQLLLMAGRTLTDSLDDAPAIDQTKRTYFHDLNAPPVWVDGSGLSRYNQFSPQTMVRAWSSIAARIPSARLYRLINRYPAGSAKPYVFAKTGTLSNNWCLSGFIETRSGRTLLFSSMNANFTVPARVIRAELEKTLQYIHEHF